MSWLFHGSFHVVTPCSHYNLLRQIWYCTEQMATLISHSIYNQLAVVLRAASIQACSISARSGSSEATWAENEAFWDSNSDRKMVWHWWRESAKALHSGCHLACNEPVYIIYLSIASVPSECTYRCSQFGVVSESTVICRALRSLWAPPGGGSKSGWPMW